MSAQVRVETVERPLMELRRASVRPECKTCECYQGLATQLELDAEAEARALIEPLKVSREKLHRCLGCEPCPPGEVFARYLRQAQESCRCGDSGGCGRSRADSRRRKRED